MCCASSRWGSDSHDTRWMNCVAMCVFPCLFAFTTASSSGIITFLCYCMYHSHCFLRVSNLLNKPNSELCHLTLRTEASCYVIITAGSTRWWVEGHTFTFTFILKYFVPVSFLQPQRNPEICLKLRIFQKKQNGWLSIHMFQWHCNLVSCKL